MSIKLSTILSFLFYLLPLYLFVFAPLLRQFFPEEESPLSPSTADYLFPNSANDQDADDLAPSQALNLVDDTFISIDDGITPECPLDPTYRIHFLSRTPLVIYIEGFLTTPEADHLVDISVGKYTPSIIYNGITERVDPSTRLSERALLDRDHTVRCIEDRARAFQGWRPHLYIERMWAQRYNASGHYRHHYDWAGSVARGGDRASTFMVYLDDNCTGGGTNFPRLRMPVDRRWCRFLECHGDEETLEVGDGAKDTAPRKETARARGTGEGITFKPIKGNAIFWENLRPDGTGYPETWHAALPVTSGTKVGLNIWSWYQPPRRG
ncbi:hypothetical protein KXW29_000326 [Aspergillus fumigatus]|uniref:Oxidoreductase, 2OG-Fe(II) oxygenase family family n=2 Tax=Aspergillus fumigatus TaxID=746128 RepID=Q4WY68_ASPFU|nr:oxidoreductase, 2OG-Fe(II) oxygenase family family [Aspergillus fumigatus Af293]KAH1423749.1 hypothetical protein KXX32_007221 [Aspergillus fumigatus]EAL92385.2 oxidoreductase, 2OG-Fe(II) oxygenase family family [Aspergillus fumigatus Af293]KAH1903167.1 hypothetical protein KXV57_007072 [Aspergillus fumigatus]KAH2278436.1 hypothetical protein KXW02_006915 [Aspergillus fumigatus]KAH2722356.1 hypothetical protein KXW29_000326 [Aspergillus fumigatus]